MEKLFANRTKLIIVVLLLIGNGILFAQRPRAYLLGGGGTNMSEYRHVDNHGLRTGMYGHVHNLFGIYVDGSYSMMLNTVYLANNQPGGYGVGGGICYEHQRGMLKIHIGLGIRYQDVQNSIGDTTFFNNSVYDARGYNYQLRYDFTERVDRAYNLHAQLPVLLGLGIERWYFLTGIKANLTIDGSTFIHVNGTTSGTYEQYLGHFVEMDNHGLRKQVDLDYVGTRLTLKPDVLFSFETGYEWGEDFAPRSRYRSRAAGDWTEYRLRIAAFIDYGLLNICPQTDAALVSIPQGYKWDFPTYELNHTFATDIANGRHVHNFYAGIKITCLIGFYEYKRCVLCGDWHSEADMENPKIKQKRYQRSGNNY